MNCAYCKDNSKIHVDSTNLLNTLSYMPKKDRAIIIRFIKQMEYDYKYHSTIAIKDIDKTYCFSCGSVMERDDDGDRYYYMCTNMECKSWNGEDVI